MECSGCGNKDAHKVRMVFVSGEKYESCNACDVSSSSSPLNPDISYLYGSGTYTEENICDPQTLRPIPFSSKREKWEAMKRAGVREMGDKKHGARIEHGNTGKKYFT